MCRKFDIPTGTFFANVGYTSCPNWVVDAISEDAADGGTCSDAWTKRTEVWRDTGTAACSFQLWTTSRDRRTSTQTVVYNPGGLRFIFLGLFAIHCIVPGLPTFAERAGRRVASIWRQTVGFILFCFLGFLDESLFFRGPATLISFSS